MNVISFVFAVYGRQRSLRSTAETIVERVLEGYPHLKLQWISYTQVLQKRGFIVSITGGQDWLTTSGDIDDSPLAVGLAIQRTFDLRDHGREKAGRRPSRVVFVAAGLSEQCLGPDALVVWHGNCYTLRTSAAELPQVIHETSSE